MKTTLQFLVLLFCLNLVGMDEEEAVGGHQLTVMDDAGMAASTIQDGNVQFTIDFKNPSEGQAILPMRTTEQFTVFADGKIEFNSSLSATQRKYIQGELVSQGKCYIDEEAGQVLKIKQTRFDFEAIMESVQSIARIFGELGHLKDLWTGSEKKLGEESAARKADNQANQAKLIKTVCAGAGAFVVAATPAVIAIIKSFQQ